MRRWNTGRDYIWVSAVRTTPECFVIGSRGLASGRKRRPGRTVIIGKRRSAIAGGELQSEDASRVAIDEADWIKPIDDGDSSVLPEGGRRKGGIVKIYTELFDACGKEGNATGVDLVVFERRDLGKPVDTNRWFACAIPKRRGRNVI
jgi:hypothetical protein